VGGQPLGLGRGVQAHVKTNPYTKGWKKVAKAWDEGFSAGEREGRIAALREILPRAGLSWYRDIIIAELEKLGAGERDDG
jgi:hypothetical protein